MNTRIVQLVPVSCPLWVVFARDEPDEQGNAFWTEPVVSLALVEEWDSSPWSVDAKRERNRDRHIEPVCVHDGLFLDVDDSDRLALTDRLPTPEDALAFNAEARERIERRTRLRREKAAGTVNG